MSEIKEISKHSFAARVDDGRVFILSNRTTDPFDNSLGPFVWGSNRNWEDTPVYAAGAKVVPYGPSNNLPASIRDVVSENNLVPGIINRQLGLLWGQGPHLYQLGYEGGEVTKIWMDDPDIRSWLNAWDFEDYLRGCIIDYLHLGGFFNSVHLEKGARIGRGKRIAYLAHIPAKNARLGWTDTRQLKDVKNIYVGDFEHGCINTGIRSYPVYDRKDPGKYAASAAYNHLYSFSRDFYSVPQFWGALRWIIRGSEIPVIFKFVTENSINLAYHVHSPACYWENKRDSIRNAHPDWDDKKLDAKISEITTEILKNMTEVLAGKENAGKMFHTVDFPDETGHLQSWKIEAIDQKTKDFIDSQLKIAESSTSAITSGMGLHPSLSNVMVNGKLASGSELVYAFKLYLNTDTEIPSSIILEGLNQAIDYNFPGKNIKLGFYHKSVKTEESVSSSDRIKNE